MQVASKTKFLQRSIFDNAAIWIPVILIADLLIVSIPLHLLIGKLYQPSIAKAIAYIIQCVFRISLVVLFIRKLGFFSSVSFHPLRVSNPAYLIIPFLFPLLITVPQLLNIHFKEFISVSILITCLAYFLMALAEEVLIRGLILSAFLRKYKEKNVMRAVLISAAIFSLMHLINLVKFNYVMVLTQLIIAFYFGVFFGALMIKTRNLLYLGLIHGIINICFNLDEILGKTTTKKYVEGWQEIVKSIITTAIVLSPLLIIGLLILARNKKLIEQSYKN